MPNLDCNLQYNADSPTLIQDVAFFFFIGNMA